MALEQVLKVSSRQYNSLIIPSLILTYTMLVPEGRNVTPVHLAMLFWKSGGQWIEIPFSLQPNTVSRVSDGGQSETTVKITGLSLCVVLRYMRYSIQ
jgi:hypothetical protein